jgi:oligopeptide transport system permease protein
MLKKIFIKIISNTILAFIVVSFIFFALYIAPGDPRAILTEQYCNTSNDLSLSLEKGFLNNYLFYMKSLVTLNFGKSINYKREVWDLISSRWFHTIILSIKSITLSIFLLFSIGSISVMFLGSFFEKTVDFIISMATSVPSFVTAIFVQSFFGDYFSMSLNSGNVSFLPAISLGIVPGLLGSQIFKASLLKSFNSEYILLAKSKGLSELRIFFRHILPNSIIPVVSYLSRILILTLTGTVVIEKIYSIPGIGALYIEAIEMKDFPLVIGISYLFSLISLFVMSFVEVLKSILIPKNERNR